MTKKKKPLFEQREIKWFQIHDTNVIEQDFLITSVSRMDKACRGLLSTRLVLASRAGLQIPAGVVASI